MPSNIFANTGTNVSILFVDKSKKDDKILLMDASNYGEKKKEGKNKKTSLRDFEITKIIDSFTNLVEEDKFSVLVTNNEISSKNYTFAAGPYFKIKIATPLYSKEEYKELIIKYNNELKNLYAINKELEKDVLSILEVHQND